MHVMCNPPLHSSNLSFTFSLTTPPSLNPSLTTIHTLNPSFISPLLARLLFLV